MKTISAFTVSVFLLLQYCPCFGQEANVNGSEYLVHIQEKVHDAYGAAEKSNDPDGLLKIEQNLQSIATTNLMTKYWGAYNKLYLAVYFSRHGDRAQSEAKINEAISVLESIDNANTETLALLAYAQSYSIQFATGMQAGIISGRALKSAQKSRVLDDKNPRAWYVLGMLNFHTPKAYGGQTECEEDFIKAISLEEPNLLNPYLPTWGKDDAYALLIQYYISSGNMGKASDTFRGAIAAYPSNPTILHFSKHFNE